MALGTPVSTNRFQIGNAEVRIGPQSLANKLNQAHSVGLLESCTVKFEQQAVELKAGIPKTLIDQKITETVITVEARAYEYSRKNILVMTNGGVSTTEPAERRGVIMAAAVTSASTFQTDIPSANLAVGDLLVVYSPSSPEKVSVVQVSNVAVGGSGNTAGSTITIVPGKTPLLFDIAVNDIVYRANQIGLGASTATNYFSLDVLGTENASGKPIGFKFWKAAVSGGLDYSFSNDNYAVTPLTFKVLQPAAAEWASGAAMEHLSNIIPTHPLGMQFQG
jgi:hypothetical protein